MSAQLKPVLHVVGETKPNSYIVKLKSIANKEVHLEWLSTRPGADVTYRQWSSSVLYGYAVTIDNDDTLNALRAHPDVDFIEEDGDAGTSDFVQQNSPWGLQRISQRPAFPDDSDPDVLTYEFKYKYTGSGADIYMIDTGIYTEHVDFGGRAKWGITFGGYQNKDGNGHGTHCAGTAGSQTYGVAKEATLIAVKVLPDSGPGSISDVISGVDWAATQQAQTGRPSVVCMPLGATGPSRALDDSARALDDSVNGASNMGLLVVVAAGNSNDDAKNYSPGRADEAFTVGASNIRDVMSSFSNYGAAVDLFAPGERVISTYNRSPEATKNLFGTSMATSHVAGMAAALWAADKSMTPSQVKDIMRKYATKGALGELPPDTANLLAYNGDETA